MSNLAAYLTAKGCKVSGSDMNDSDAVKKVRELGVDVIVGHKEANVPPDTELLVATAAAPPENPEIVAAVKRGILVLKYAQMLGHIMRECRGLAVAGTHGKTTTTSMISYILKRAGRDPSFMIGGTVPQLSEKDKPTDCVGESDLMVVEACEYDRSFLNLSPEVAVITNIDYDHCDYFKGEDDLVSAFAQFTERIKPGGVMVYNLDDRLTRDALAVRGPGALFFGTSADADWRFDLQSFLRADGESSFEVYLRGDSLGRFTLLVPGVHNAYNALAAAAVCHSLEVDIETIRTALAEFAGAHRRCEYLGSVDGIDVIDDFGHHPTEIAATLGALRQDYPGRRVWCVFQPHQHSRTKALMEGFAGAFGDVDCALVTDIYFCRDTDEDRENVTSAQLVDRMKEKGADAQHTPSYDDAVETLISGVEPGDVVITMGAGPVCEVGCAFLDQISADREGKSIAISA